MKKLDENKLETYSSYGMYYMTINSHISPEYVVGGKDIMIFRGRWKINKGHTFSLEYWNNLIGSTLAHLVPVGVKVDSVCEFDDKEEFIEYVNKMNLVKKLRQ